MAENKVHKLVSEFATILQLALENDPDARKISLGPLERVRRGSQIRFTPTYVGVPKGKAVHPTIKHCWMPDRADLVELLARTIELRSLRYEWTTDTVALPSDTWLEQLQRDYPGSFECEVSCNGGWSDLIRAYMELQTSRGHPAPIFRQIKEKLGGLRLFEDVVRSELDEIACFLSEAICEVCGAPGERGENGIGWISTRCRFHLRR